MDRKHFILLICCILVMSMILVALYSFSPLNKEIYRGGFVREFVSQEPVLVQKHVLDLGVNSYYISGATDTNIYFSNYTAPFHLLRSNAALTDTQRIQIRLIGIDSLKEPKRFRTFVEPPYFYLANGAMPEILKGDEGKWQARKFIPYNPYYFVEALPINDKRFVVRSYSQIQKAFQLAKLTSIDTPYFEFQFDVLQKKLDGLFCSDGELHYSEDLDRVIYLYKYRNEYIVADTGLNVAYRGNTIDGFKLAPITIADVNSQGENMLGSPAYVINGKSCVDGHFLYVNSRVLAKNESQEQFTTNSVIDVYDLTAGKYVHSFYLPYFQGAPCSDFRLAGNQLIAICDRFAVVYEVNDDVTVPRRQVLGGH